MDEVNYTSQVPSLSPATATSYPQHAIIFHTILLILGFFIVVNNLTVICLYHKRRELQHRTNFLLIGLAATDLLAGLFCIPFVVASSVFSILNCKLFALNFLANTLSDFAIFTNILTLCLIFTERYLSICRPVTSRNFLTLKMIRNCIAVIWTVSLILVVLPLCWSYKAVAKLPVSPQYIKLMNKSNVIHSLFVLICCFILPSLMILFYSIAVMRMIFLVSADSSQRKKTAGRRKAFCLLFAMFILQLCAWSPLIVVRIMLDLGEPVRLTRQTVESFVAVRYLTCLVNPFVHTLCKEDYRKALLKLFKARQTPSEEILMDNA